MQVGVINVISFWEMAWSHIINIGDHHYNVNIIFILFYVNMTYTVEVCIQIQVFAPKTAIRYSFQHLGIGARLQNIPSEANSKSNSKQVKLARCGR